MSFLLIHRVGVQVLRVDAIVLMETILQYLLRMMHFVIVVGNARELFAFFS
jgi:hypothetical protein